MAGVVSETASDLFIVFPEKPFEERFLLVFFSRF